ncbi:TonB family protein [Hyphomicrobium sp. 99]|uniref:cell envelope integrity protein TolA n=1 Tax=Hyphomicrobium sp. 99 TaxID=1163419 RepID=UPI0018CF930D|nr:TonB family protein [Hyphomicrobium sp. 99]
MAPPSNLTKAESRKLLVATIVISATIHAAAIASVMSGDTGEQFGMLDSKTDTFSLATTQSVVLESISTHDAQTASAAAAASQAGSVESAESAPQDMAEVKEPLSDDPPPTPIKVADVTPTAVAPTEDPLQVIRGGGEPDTVSEIKAAEFSETPVEEMPEAVETKDDAPAKAKQEEKVEKERKVQQEESHYQTAGGSASRSSAEHAVVDGRASASRGNALSYAAGVRARVERNKPSGNGLRGTVRVSFGITTTGELSYVKLSESSGSAKLDQVAMDAVRQAAPFDEPPSDLSPSQLAYVIPFYFR